MQQAQGRLCRYCGHNNKNEKAQACHGCGGSLAPLAPPSRIKGTIPAEPVAAKSPVPALMIAIACIAVVGIAMIVPLPSHGSTRAAKPHVQGQLKSHTVSYVTESRTVEEMRNANAQVVDGCERSRLDSNEAIADYKDGKYFDGFVKADTAVKLAQLSCPRTLKPVRLGYAFSARAFNGRHLDSVDPRLDFEEANNNLNACSESPQIYGSATSSACADQQQRNVTAYQGLVNRKAVTSA